MRMELCISLLFNKVTIPPLVRVTLFFGLVFLKKKKRGFAGDISTD